MGIKTLLWNGDASSSAKVVNAAWRWAGSRRARMDRVLFGGAVCGCQAGWAERAHGGGLCSAWVRVPGCWLGHGPAAGGTTRGPALVTSWL